jgi:predicted XRE-type DNA-binding protein
LRDFPETARKQAGYELRKLQRGEAPDDWRPFPEIGPGANEIRIDCPDGWFRVMYVIKFEEAVYAPQFPEEDPENQPRRRRNCQDTLSRGGSRKEHIEMTIDTKSRHRTRAGGNVFLDLGFPPREAKRLLAHADVQIDESIRLKQQLMDEIAEWMKEASVTQAVAAEVLHVTRPRVSDVVNHKVEKFTIDALVSMLGRIGKQVRLAVQ